MEQLPLKAAEQQDQGIFRRIEQREKLRELATSEIELSFFRHGEKEKDKSKSDYDIELTKEGSKKAVAKSKTNNIKQSVAFGSPRKRAQQTAGLIMAGQEDNISGEESFAELKDKLDKDLKVGSKIGKEKRLDFFMDMSRPYDQQVMEAFTKGAFLSFLFNDSDRLAQKEGIKEGITYSGTAKDVAEIVEKYLKVAPRWDKLVLKDKEKYSRLLERFFGSHQGVLEAFLAKVIEKKQGVKARDQFARVLNNQGFDFLEGFNINIINQGGKPFVFISYKKEKDGQTVFEVEEYLTKSFLEEIIKEGK